MDDSKKFPFQQVVVVSDCQEDYTISNHQFSRNRDKASVENTRSLVQSLRLSFESVILCRNPRDLIQNIDEHKNAIVFPYWHGENSRSRFALVASICESYNLPYVGGDAYSNIICGDKILSKDVCRLNGLNSPRYIVLNDPILDVQHMNLTYPVVVKPIYEGSSVGITQNNLIKHRDKVLPFAESLMHEFKQPIMVEEFIPGKEICIAIIGYKDKIKYWGAVERHKLDNDSYFDNNLYGYHDKMSKNFATKDASLFLSNETLDRVFKTFSWLDKIEYIRVDGKLFENRFYCIELSHDTSLNKRGSFFQALKYAGLDYDAAIQAMILNCLERHESLYSNLS